MYVKTNRSKLGELALFYCVPLGDDELPNLRASPKTFFAKVFMKVLGLPNFPSMVLISSMVASAVAGNVDFIFVGFIKCQTDLQRCFSTFPGCDHILP